MIDENNLCIWIDKHHEANRLATRKFYVEKIKKYNRSLLVRLGIKKKAKL